MKNKILTKKEVLNIVSNTAIDLFAHCFFWILIWVGGVLALINSGASSLALLLFLSGMAKLYLEVKKLKENKK